MSLTRLIIARHGNTFRPDEIPTRAGCRTDLPLVEETKGRAIGRYLLEKGWLPDITYCSPLQRTLQTAQLALQELNVAVTPIIVECFNEIDYGPDENQPEEAVMLRLGEGDMERGKAIIKAWNDEAVVPNGWLVDTELIIKQWLQFSIMISNHNRLESNVLVVSSNGIIRFAPYLTGNFNKFAQNHSIKVKTGGICVLEKYDSETYWTLRHWNV